jgi:hypothetical protein
MRALASLLLPIPAAVLLAACGSTAWEPPPPDQTTIAIIPSLTSIDGGATIRLTLTARQADGTVLHPIGATWRSSDLAVATVAEGGLVRGGVPGQAQITAQWQGVSGTALVKVLPAFKGKDGNEPCEASLRIPGTSKDGGCRR